MAYFELFPWSGLLRVSWAHLLFQFLRKLMRFADLFWVFFCIWVHKGGSLKVWHSHRMALNPVQSIYLSPPKSHRSESQRWFSWGTTFVCWCALQICFESFPRSVCRPLRIDLIFLLNFCGTNALCRFVLSFCLVHLPPLKDRVKFFPYLSSPESHGSESQR